MALPNPKVTLKINGKGLSGPLTLSTTGLNSGLSLSSGLDDQTWSGIRINPGELMKTQPFNNLSKKVDALVVIVQTLARRAGMSQAEIDELVKSAMVSIEVADELMEK